MSVNHQSSTRTDTPLPDRLQPSAPIVLMAIMLLALILLMVRAAGLYPAVMRDEYTHSMMSRLMTFQEASIPGYLYIAIYQATSLCGSASLFCSKFFNVLFFVAAAPFIHAVARRGASAARSSLC